MRKIITKGKEGRLVHVSLPVSTTLGVENAKKAGGVSLIVMPVGIVNVEKAVLNITGTVSVACTVNPEFGIGSLVGSGENDVLSGVGETAQDVVDGYSAGALTGDTPKAYGAVAKNIETDLIDGLAGAKTLYFNYAGDWTGVTGTVTLTGTIDLWYRIYND